MKRLGSCAVLALVLVACLPPSGTRFEATVRQPDGTYPIPVVLHDDTGFVTSIEPATGDSSGADTTVQADPADPNAVIVGWATGACSDDVGMAFQRAEPGYRLDVRVNEGFSLGCTAQLVLRRLRIQFSEPIAPDSIIAAGGL